jgi:hypothetical protein
MTLPENLNTSEPVEQDPAQVHDDNYVYNQIRDLLSSKFATPLDLNNAIRTEEVTIQFENNSQENTDLRNVRVGNGTITFANGVFTLETGADGAQAQAIETANIGEYSAGLPAGIGLEIEKDSDPSGFAEWGYGGDVFTDGFYWRLESDGSYKFVREKGGVKTNITRDLWEPTVDREIVTNENGVETGVVTGLDPLDGSADSGVDISTPVLGLFGVDFVLYGGGGFAPWHVDLTAQQEVEKVYPFVFHPTTENILEQFNQPIFARIDNDGTAESDSLTVTERQFTVFGSAASPQRGSQHVFDLNKTVSSPTCIIAIRRADPAGGTRLDILESVLQTDNDVHLWYLVDPDPVANNGDANWVQPQRDFAGNIASSTETSIEVNEALTVDAATGVALDGDIVEGGNRNQTSPGTTSFRSSAFIRDRPVCIMAEPFAGANDSTTQEGIINVNEGF